MSYCAFGHVRPVKTQISLRIRAVWSVFTGRSVCSQGFRFSSSGQRGWSDCANAQADLSLRWRTCPQVYYFAYASTVIPIMLFMLNLSCNILKHFPLDNWQTSMERVTKRKMWPILAYIVIHCVAAELTYSGNGESKYKVSCYICNLYVMH